MVLVLLASTALAAPSLAGENVSRGILLAAPQGDPATCAAFADALLDLLSAREAGQAVLLGASSALLRAAGVSGDQHSAVLAAAPEEAAGLLLAWAQQMGLTELARVVLGPASEPARCEVLWARSAAGQVRQAVAGLPQALTRDTAPLLAAKVAQVLLRGWEEAGTIASSGNPPAPGTVPEIAPLPGPVTVPSPAPTSTAPEAAPTTLLQAARAALAEGDAARALELTNRALEAGEDRVQALLLRAQCHGLLQQSEKQREALAAAIALDKSLYGPRLELAALEQGRGLWQSAVALYREAIAAQPQEPAAYLALSFVYQRQRRPEQALQVLQEGAKAAPGNLSLLKVLAAEYKRRGLLAAAEETYAEMVGLSEGAAKAEALQELGRLYLEAGQFAAAFDALRQAAQHVPAGQPVSYQELFLACDRTVRQALEAAFVALGDLDRRGPAVREEVYKRLAAAVSQIQKIKDFAAPLDLPAAQRLPLAQRLVYYALALEATTNALVYVDTGDPNLRTQAEQRRQEALAMPEVWQTPS